MTVTVSVRSRTHAVTYVSDNVLRSLLEIIRRSGLDPARMADDWQTLHSGIKVWIESGHLDRVILEVYSPAASSKVLVRWDIEVSYAYTDGDGQFWTDTDAIRYAIQKAGVFPSTALYDIKVHVGPNHPQVPGWMGTTMRSTSGMVVQRIGTGIEASGLSGSISYYRRV